MAPIPDAISHQCIMQCNACLTARPVSCSRSSAMLKKPVRMRTTRCLSESVSAFPSGHLYETTLMQNHHRNMCPRVCWQSLKVPFLRALVAKTVLKDEGGRQMLAARCYAARVCACPHDPDALCPLIQALRAAAKQPDYETIRSFLIMLYRLPNALPFGVNLHHQFLTRVHAGPINATGR